MNDKISKMFNEIAGYEDSIGRKFPARSFRKVAGLLAGMSEIKSTPRGIEGFGESSLEILDEYFRTGKSSRHELALNSKIKSKKDDSFYPVSEKDEVVRDLIKVPGIGEVTAGKLYDYGFRSKKMFVDRVKGMNEGDAIGTSGVSVTKAIKVGLEFMAHTDENRMTVEEHDAIANPILEAIRNCGIDREKVCVAGSRRRGKSTIGDIDIIIADNANHGEILGFCKGLLDDILVAGDKKVSGIKSRRQVDFRIVNEDQFGAMLLHATGSAEFNRMMRSKAIDKGWKLSEYGLRERDTDKVIASETEEEIFKALDMEYVKPENRSI